MLKEISMGKFEKAKENKLIKIENILLIVVALFWFAQYVYIPYQTPFLTSKNVSAGMIGTIVGAYGITQMIIRFPLGVLADCAGKHKVFITLGAIFATIAALVRITMPTGVGFLLANLIGGCASSMWISYMVLFSNYYSKDQQQKATGKILMVANLGMCLGFVFSWILYDKIGMILICTASLVSSGLAIFVSIFVKEEKKDKEKINLNKILDSISICKNRNLIIFTLLTLIQQGIQMTTAMSFTTEILRRLGATSAFIGASSIFYMIIAVISAQFSASKFCQKKGARLYIPLVFALVGVYCVLVSTLNNIYLIFILQVLPGLSTGILLTYLISEAMKEVPSTKKTTAMGFFQAVSAIGMTIFPIIVGNLIDDFSIRVGFMFLMAMAFVGVIIFEIYYFFTNHNKKKTKV